MTQQASHRPRLPSGSRRQSQQPGADVADRGSSQDANDFGRRAAIVRHGKDVPNFRSPNGAVIDARTGWIGVGRCRFHTSQCHQVHQAVQTIGSGNGFLALQLQFSRIHPGAAGGHLGRGGVKRRPPAENDDPRSTFTWIVVLASIVIVCRLFKQTGSWLSLITCMATHTGAILLSFHTKRRRNFLSIIAIRLTFVIALLAHS
mmetsp:Transcript_8110/g.17569  ORF Transcript_8110/g.17569 Transcript_8110/m.17569 type:complete len:203 (-) Transcript_8110:191-799(-)